MLPTTINPRTLYLVGTPLGNLSDLSPRAIDILRGVDFIAAEDTRVTIKLLNHFSIKKPQISYFSHNRREKGEQIIQRLQAGEAAALVTDAGMPGISDPGEELVALCRENHLPVVAIPGATACTTALALSGLPSGRFCFEGFLSTTRKNRLAHLESLKTEERTMIFYEAPHKLMSTLTDMLKTWGDRDITICREMTKRFEETLYTTLSDAVAHFTQTSPRGEFVLVIRGADSVEESPRVSLEEAEQRLKDLVEKGMSRKDAARQVAASTGLGKNEVYGLGL